MVQMLFLCWHTESLLLKNIQNQILVPKLTTEIDTRVILVNTVLIQVLIHITVLWTIFSKHQVSQKNYVWCTVEYVLFIEIQSEEIKWQDKISLK
jgi:hypothetical protein